MKDAMDVRKDYVELEAEVERLQDNLERVRNGKNLAMKVCKEKQQKLTEANELIERLADALELWVEYVVNYPDAPMPHAETKKALANKNGGV